MTIYNIFHQLPTLVSNIYLESSHVTELFVDINVSFYKLALTALVIIVLICLPQLCWSLPPSLLCWLPLTLRVADCFH